MALGDFCEDDSLKEHDPSDYVIIIDKIVKIVDKAAEKPNLSWRKLG